MRTALEAGDDSGIRAGVSELEESFDSFFRVFGDFSPITS